MNKPPAFQFYPADFLADENVVLMSNREVGCYIKLMCYCWRQGSIPKDVTAIARLCGEDEISMVNLWPQISKCFTPNGERHIHKRLEKERQKQISHRRERSESGKRGAAKRWSNKDPDSSAIAQLPSEPLANDSSSSSSSSSTSVFKGTIVPYGEIVSLYHEILPEMPRVKILSEERKRQIKARVLGDYEKAHDLAWWRKFFEYVRGCPFLMGETKEKWTGCDLEWLTKKANFIKVIEGKYSK